MQPHENDSRTCTRSVSFAALATLTAVAFLAQGFHPFAEDGGLYVAGVRWLLNPALYPHNAAFVTEHLSFSLFAPLLASIVRTTHLPLAWALLLADWLSLALTLTAGAAILRRCGVSRAAQLGGTALLAAWATLPVAGTSLFLIDPYVTARSFSTPLSLFALALAMDDWKLHRQVQRRFHPAALCLATLLVAAAFHPLMAVYAAGLVLMLRLGRLRRGWLAWIFFAAAVLIGAGTLQALARPESAASNAAAISRYYWFLSQWRWFELLGLAGPLTVFVALLLWTQFGRRPRAAALIHAAIVYALIAVAATLLFAQEHFHAHVIARLQPLRVFLEIYALLPLFLGAWIVETAGGFAARHPSTRRMTFTTLVLFFAANFALFFSINRASFPDSPHIEWPWRTNPNPWVQAFLWARDRTPQDALFALDAKYVNQRGEDAQTFRAISERSALPDFSKDGGEAAISPTLAQAWQQGAEAQRNLSSLNDAERDRRLLPLGVTWMVLRADAITSHLCPYRNATVKVCQLAGSD